MRCLVVLALISACLAGGNASAAGKQEHQPLRFSPALFAEQRENIIEDLGDGIYRELSDADRQRVLEALSRMADKLEDVSQFDQLDKRDQTTVFNDQELINNLLSEAAADSRLICKREKFVGSHRTTNVCLTVAERRRLAEAAQEQMRGLQGSGYLPPDKT